jgi:NAD-dependent deacetylase
MLVIGTSAVVYPAAALPPLAQRHGAYVAEINPEPTPLSSIVDERLAGPAGAVVPALLRAAGLDAEAR